MRLTFISDTHSKHNDLKLEPCDILIHCGDLTKDIGQADLRIFCKWFDEQNAKHKIFIAGNHDGAFEKWPDLAKLMVKEYCKENVHYLQDSGVEIEGIKFWGSPVTPEFYNWFFNRTRGEEIKRHWDMIPDGTDVLVTHGPPVGFGDWSPCDKVSTGCIDLLYAIQRIKPKIHACGHIHNGYGVRNLEDIMMINAASCNENYKVENKPIEVDYDTATKKVSIHAGH
jgi:Icc-related predicted phosphoesterase